MKLILGKKIGMTQIFNEKGDFVSVTLIEADTSIFEEGEKVQISGISKGKGFQGAVKKWGFAGKSSSHGAKHKARSVGSIGSRFPQRVIKGKKMPGRMGSERVTVKNLLIVKVDKDNNLIAIKGAVPGSKGTVLEIKK